MNIPKTNITNGIPPEIYVAIGRGRYDDDLYQLAEDIVKYFECEIQSLQAENQQLKSKIGEL